MVMDTQPLNILLEKLAAMDKKFDENIAKVADSFTQRFDTLDNKIKILDSLPELTRRVDENAAGLEDLRQQFDDLKKQVTTSNVTTDNLTALQEQVKLLESNNASLNKQLSGTASASKSTKSDSTNVVIGGLSIPLNANLRKIATAVLATVYTDLDPRDVVSARFLTRRNKNADEGAATPELTTSTSTLAAGAEKYTGTKPKQLSGNSRISNLSNSTDNDHLNASTSRLSPSPLPTPVLVTLHSRPVLLAVMRSKVKMGKLHTSDVLPNLPMEITADQIGPGLININEFLPAATHRLHNLVRYKARQPDSGFVVFVRNGQIYVRRKKGDVPTPISRKEDLDHFLSI